MLRDVKTTISDGLLGFATATGDGLSVKIGASPVVSDTPVIVTGDMDAAKIRGRLGLSPLADAAMDAVQGGAARIFCLPVAATTAGALTQVKKAGEGGGNLTVDGSPTNAFQVVIEITAQGGLNIARLSSVFPEAEEQIAEILAGYRITRETGREGGGLAKRINLFLAAKKIDGLSPKTLKNYREMLASFAARVDKPAGKITADDIREYIGYLAEERRLKDSSIQTHINTLRSFFGWLDAEDAIKKNPMRKIKSLKIDRAKARRPLTAEQLEQLRDGCRTYKEKALVEFLVSSGCRLSEAVGIRAEAVDWQGRSVVVLGKGGKERTVYFSVRAKLMLQEYIAHRKGGEALFASSRAPYGPMKPRAVQRALKKIGERAGTPLNIHPHLMRHTFASNALNAGMDITIIQHLLGHTDPKTTLIYAELAPRTVKYEYERVVA